MKQKLPRWKAIAVAVVRRYLALDMTVYAGSATLFLLTASFPLLMWVLMLVNLLPGFSVEGVAELLADFMPQIPAVQTSILQLLQNLSGQSAQFAASLAVLTTIVSASGGISALQIGLQRLTPGSKRTFLNRLLAIGYTFVFELLLLVMLALQGMKSLFARFADTLPFFRHYAPIVHQLQRIASIGQIVTVPLLFGLLLLIYTYVPGGRRTLRSQLPGAVFATAVVHLRLTDRSHPGDCVAVCDYQSAVYRGGAECGATSQRLLPWGRSCPQSGLMRGRACHTCSSWGGSDKDAPHPTLRATFPQGGRLPQPQTKPRRPSPGTALYFTYYRLIS